MKKAKVKVSKKDYKSSKGELSTYRMEFTPKQTEKYRKKVGMTIHSVDIIFNEGKKKATVGRMYRNGKRIHRKSVFKVRFKKH